MDYYHIWCNLRPGVKDLDFAKSVADWLGHLQKMGQISGFSLARRKLGFGPAELGEFHIVVEAAGLAQLDEAFGEAARREGDTERLHLKVYASVTEFRSALYRSFPDAVRTGPGKAPLP